MRAGNASRSETRRRGPAALVFTLAMTLLVAAGCYQNPDPTEWNEAAHKNFVLGCTTSTTANRGTTSTSLIASKDTCECIYNLIKKPDPGEQGKYAISWDDLKTYEAKQAAAKPADKPPAIPRNLQKALDECKVKGPGL